MTALMSFQLVLQWPVSSIEDYDALIELEEAFLEGASSDISVDGHDAGSGEFNIFVLTTDPNRTFADLKKIVDNFKMTQGLRAGYRSLKAELYTAIWPTHLASFKIG